MQVTRTSMFTGKVHTLELQVTQDQLDRYTNTRMLIQEAFPQLSDAEREFIKTGVTPEEWDAVFGCDD